MSDRGFPKNSRGMSMREMKARQLGRAPIIKPKHEKVMPPDLADEEEDCGELVLEGALVHQQDGVFAHQGRKQTESETPYEYPDEPPTGWLQ